MPHSPEPAEAYLSLRAKVLGLDPAEVGITPSPRFPRVWMVLADIGYPAAVATLVAVADGTTSLYLSNGGGMIGAGGHQEVATATLGLLDIVEQHLDRMPATVDTSLPRPRRVVLRALTYQGQRAIEADEQDLGHGRHALSPVFHAVHAVITELRLVDEARR